MGEDRGGGGAAAGEGVLVQRQRPGVVGGRVAEGRVLLALGGFLRPDLDLAVAGGAVVVQCLKEVGRPARLLLGGAPPVAGAEEQGAGRVKVT